MDKRGTPYALLSCQEKEEFARWEVSRGEFCLVGFGRELEWPHFSGYLKKLCLEIHLKYRH